MRTWWKTGVSVIALAALVMLSACTAPGGGTSGTNTGGAPSGTGTSATESSGTTGAASNGQISMRDFAFTPANIEVKVGTKVTWRNDDSAAHTVTADEGQFTSPTMAQGQTYSFTFSTPGTYPYHCSIHPSMVGQVVVK